jgi:TPR repeat protein
VLAALVHLDEGIGLKGYTAITEQAQKMLATEQQRRAASGDLDALYEMALDRLFESVEKRSLQYLAEAESLLRKAAERGHVQAANFLQHVWPEESKSRRQKILRKPSE